MKDTELLTKDNEFASDASDISNLLWHLVRMYPTNLLVRDDLEQEWIPPTWSVFNDKTTNTDLKETVIGYGSILPKYPTSPDVVEESVDNCV